MAYGNMKSRMERATPLVGAMLLAIFATVRADAEEPAADARAAAPTAAAPPAQPAEDGKQHKRFNAQAPPNARIRVPGMMSSGEVTDEQTFDGWWRFRVAEITVGENGPQLAELRRRLKQEMRPPARDPARQRAVGVIRQSAAEIVRDAEYSPAARISAVLILGELNQTEPDYKGDNAIPLPAGQAELLRMVKDPKVDDMQDALRAAALVGLQRHAETTLPDAAKQQISAAMKELAASDQPPEGRSTEVHAWLTARARGILSSLGVDVSVRAEAAP